MNCERIIFRATKELKLKFENRCTSEKRGIVLRELLRMYVEGEVKVKITV